MAKPFPLMVLTPEREFYSGNAVYVSVETIAGSIGVISMRWDDWTGDDDIAVAGVGAGLTWSSFLLRFGGRP